MRGFVISTPTFALQPGEAKTVDFAIVFAQGADHLDSVTGLKAASDAVQSAYDAGELFDDPMPVATEEATTPGSLTLRAAYPNPFRSRTSVTFEVPEAGPVRLAVHDLLGRRVRTLVEGPLAAGEHTASFEATGLPSGLYLVVLEAGGRRETGKVVLVR